MLVLYFTYFEKRFSVSTELIFVSMRDSEWRKLIPKIRKVYDGKLVSASNWAGVPTGGELTDKRWWDLVDYIGCDVYYPLPNGERITMEMVVKAWNPLIDQFKRLHERYEKPFILTEVRNQLLFLSKIYFK